MPLCLRVKKKSRLRVCVPSCQKNLRVSLCFLPLRLCSFASFARNNTAVQKVGEFRLPMLVFSPIIKVQGQAPFTFRGKGWGRGLKQIQIPPIPIWKKLLCIFNIQMLLSNFIKHRSKICCNRQVSPIF